MYKEKIFVSIAVHKLNTTNLRAAPLFQCSEFALQNGQKNNLAKTKIRGQPRFLSEIMQFYSSQKKKMPLLLGTSCCLIISKTKKMLGYVTPTSLFPIPKVLAKICFPRIVISREKNTIVFGGTVLKSHTLNLRNSLPPPPPTHTLFRG